jgi:hypothetical protein
LGADSLLTKQHIPAIIRSRARGHAIHQQVNMIAHFLLFFAALVVFLSILTISATMLSSSITTAEDPCEVMEFDAPSAEITKTQDRSPTNPAGVF